MTARCTDLDVFFDGELEPEQAAAFRDHLATCERCRRVLHGRMQEEVAAAGEPDEAASEAAGASPLETARSRHVRRTLVYLAPILSAAAVAAIWLLRSGEHTGAKSLELAFTIERGEPEMRRGHTAHRGDVLRPTVRGDRFRAIRVYLDDRELVVACPGADARCHSGADELEVEIRLTARGRYSIIALGSTDSALAPRDTFDEMRATAETAGVPVRVDYVDVD